MLSFVLSEASIIPDPTEPPMPDPMPDPDLSEPLLMSASAIIPEDPSTPDPNEDPSRPPPVEDPVDPFEPPIDEPDLVDPPVEEPPPGWGA